jgi:hypothetical protein
MLSDSYVFLESAAHGLKVYQNKKKGSIAAPLMVRSGFVVGSTMQGHALLL